MDFLSKPSPIRPTFFKDVDGQRDMVELKIVGDPNTIIRKVTPEIAAEYQREWDAYSANSEHVVIEGTPLTEVPGVDRNAAVSLKMHGVRTAEELAALDEAQARALGLGGITFWKTAQNMIKLRQLEAMQAAMEQAQPRRGRPPKTDEAQT